jgi:hypothetical protein
MTCDFERYIPYFICYFLVAFLVYLFFPWSKSNGFRRATINVLPLSSMLLYFFYEWAMLTSCPQVNIRLDIFITWPTVGGILIFYLIKLALLKPGGQGKSDKI